MLSWQVDSIEWLQDRLDRLLHNRNNNQNPIAKLRINTATIQRYKIRFTSNKMTTIAPIINSKWGDRVVRARRYQ